LISPFLAGHCPGGGSRVTETGIKALAAFRAMEADAAAAIAAGVAAFQDLLADGEESAEPR